MTVCHKEPEHGTGLLPVNEANQLFLPIEVVSDQISIAKIVQPVPNRTGSGVYTVPVQFWSGMVPKLDQLF